MGSEMCIRDSNTTPDDVNQVDRAQMQPKVYLQDVGYKWVNGAFAERSVTIRNYLGSDEYFSFPPSTIKYSPNGAVSRYDLNGNYIEQVSQPNAQLAADLVNSKIQNVSPVYRQLRLSDHPAICGITMR